MRSPWFRRIAIAVGVVVLVLFVAAAVLVATFDANRYKALAIDWMKSEHQRTLAIDGPIELSFFPQLALKVSKVRLSERGRPEEFAAIDEAALAVRLLPLLSKEVVIGNVSARGVRAVYLRDAKGVRNIDDLVSAGAAPAAGAGSSDAPSSGARFDVSSVRLEDVRLRVRDQMADLAGDIVVVSLTTGRLANRAESPVTLRATAQLTRPQPARLTLDGHTTLALDLDKNALALSDMALDVTGEGADVKALALSIEGALAWEGGALRAGPLKTALKSATLGPMALGPSTLVVKRLLFDPHARRIELEALALALSGQQAQQPFQLSLDWPQLAVDPKQIKGSALSGRVKMSGQTALEGEFRSAAPTGSFDALGVPNLQLKLAGSAGPRKVDGTANADLMLHPGRGAAAIDRLVVRATLSEPDLKPVQLAVQGTAGFESKTARWKVDGSLNANRFESNGQAAFAGSVPNVKAAARFDSLDLNTLLASDGKAAPASGMATAPSDTPVRFDGLKAVNGQFAFDAGALAVRQYRVADARLTATLDNGTLRITRLTGRAWNGSFEASGSADADSRRVAVKLDATGVDVNALLKNVADKDLLEGTGRVAADLASNGATMGALRSNLAGSAAVQLRDGAIKGINLARVFRQAQAALSMKQDAVARASAVEKTDFSELRASARIADGVAHSDDLDVKSPFLRIGGAGRFDIGRGTVDYTARATVTDTAVGQGGAGLEALRGITVPVVLSGPFDAIQWTIEWSGVAAAAVEKKLKDKLNQVLGGQLGRSPAQSGSAPAPVAPTDLLRGTLKGLFK